MDAPWPKSVRDLPRVERPRERLLQRGAAALSDSDLVALILGSGVKGRGAVETARALLAGGLKGLATSDAAALVKLPGIKGAKAAGLLAAVELGRRMFAREDPETPPAVRGPEDVLRLVRPIRRARKEHFVALFLNARHQVIKQETISIGTLNASLVHPREVFQPAVGESAAAVILVHNHPSGDPSASEEDVQLTGRLVQAGRIMGIEVLDHIIVCADSYLSLKSKHWFE